jgi:hypothetical protein
MKRKTEIAHLVHSTTRLSCEEEEEEEEAR